MHFCITGTGRCGTQLLRNMFNTHPDVYVFDETHWVPKMVEFFGTGVADVDRLIDIIRRTYHITGAPTTLLDKEIANEFSGQTFLTVSEFCDILGESYARRHGKTLWADKTPEYGPYLQSLQSLWPHCRVVHIIRHGLEVAHSMSKHPGFRWMVSAQELWWVSASFNHYYQQIDITEHPISDYLDLWHWRLLRIRDEAERLLPGTYLEVRFEDLIHNPEQTLARIAAFVELPAPQEWMTEAMTMIDHDRIHNQIRYLSVGELNPYHRELLTTLEYEIPHDDRRRDIAHYRFMAKRRMKNAAKKIIKKT